MSSNGHTYCAKCGWWVKGCEHGTALTVALYWCATCGRNVADCPHH